MLGYTIHLIGQLEVSSAAAARLPGSRANNNPVDGPSWHLTRLRSARSRDNASPQTEARNTKR